MPTTKKPAPVCAACKRPIKGIPTHLSVNGEIRVMCRDCYLKHFRVKKA